MNDMRKNRAVKITILLFQNFSVSKNYKVKKINIHGVKSKIIITFRINKIYLGLLYKTFLPGGHCFLFTVFQGLEKASVCVYFFF